MFNNLLFYSFLLFFFNYSFSQQGNYKEYHHLMNKSKELHKDSVFYFNETAFQSAEPFPDDLLKLGFGYYKKGDLKNAKKLFLKAIKYGYQAKPDENYYNSLFMIEYDQNYISNHKFDFGQYLNKMYQENKKKVNKLRRKYLEEVNNNQDNRIFESLLHNEKYFQDLRFLFFNNKVEDTLALKNIFRYGSTPNSYYALDLLKKNNFPKRLNCTRWNGQSITVLLNHIVFGFLNKSDAEEFVSLLWKLVERGDLTPYEYAKTYDHYISVFVDENKNMFGTVFTFDELDNNKLIIEDLVSPAEVNTIRSKHWLIDIETFCKNTGASLPKNYVKNEP